MLRVFGHFPTTDGWNADKLESGSRRGFASSLVLLRDVVPRFGPLCLVLGFCAFACGLLAFAQSVLWKEKGESGEVPWPPEGENLETSFTSSISATMPSLRYGLGCNFRLEQKFRGVYMSTMPFYTGRYFSQSRNLATCFDGESL
jgi:hypothetical protein